MILLICLSGCATYYGIANFNSESSTLYKPPFRDSTTTGKYLTGAFYSNAPYINPTYGGNIISFGTVQYHRATTEKTLSYAYGGFIHLGNYYATDIKGFKGGNLFFYGGGITGDVSMNIVFKNIEWRMIGAKMTILTEPGEYAKYRKEIDRTFDSRGVFGFGDVIDLNPNNVSVNLSAISEIIYKHKKFDLGFSATLGMGNQLITYGNKIFFTKAQTTVFLEGNLSAHNISTGLGLTIKLQ